VAESPNGHASAHGGDDDDAHGGRGVHAHDDLYHHDHDRFLPLRKAAPKPRKQRRVLGRLSSFFYVLFSRELGRGKGEKPKEGILNSSAFFCGRGNLLAPAHIHRR